LIRSNRKVVHKDARCYHRGSREAFASVVISAPVRNLRQSSLCIIVLGQGTHSVICLWIQNVASAVHIILTNPLVSTFTSSPLSLPVADSSPPFQRPRPSRRRHPAAPTLQSPCTRVSARRRSLPRPLPTRLLLVRLAGVAGNSFARKSERRSCGGRRGHIRWRRGSVYAGLRVSGLGECRMWLLRLRGGEVWVALLGGEVVV